jgi:tetratricopeptide (TPR) repeat protein
VLRTLGDLDAAEASYAEAGSHGFEPQPGLSLLWLARGRTSAAPASAQRLLDEPTGPGQRAQRLPAVVQVLAAAGETEAARAASDELVALANGFGCDALSAGAGYAAGLVALAAAQPQDALLPLRRAWKTWIGLGARYDAARARVRIALAYRTLGDEESALSELGVAERTLPELGAEPARREAALLMRTALPDGLTSREVEVPEACGGRWEQPGDRRGSVPE